MLSFRREGLEVGWKILMMATHDWLTSRRLISININYQLIIYLKLYLNCNTINMIISLIVKIIRYCLSLRQLEVDFWQGHHQYPCCSQSCTLKASRTFYTKYRIYYLAISCLLRPSAVKIGHRHRRRCCGRVCSVCSVCSVCRVYLVLAAECYRRFVFTDHIFASDHFPTVSCGWGEEMWPPARTRTDWAQPAPATSNQTQRQHSSPGQIQVYWISHW